MQFHLGHYWLMLLDRALFNRHNSVVELSKRKLHISEVVLTLGKVLLV